MSLANVCFYLESVINFKKLETLSIQSVRLTGWQELCASLSDCLKDIYIQTVRLVKVGCGDVLSSLKALSGHHLEHLSLLEISTGRTAGRIPLPNNWLEMINLDFPRLKDSLC